MTKTLTPNDLHELHSDVFSAAEDLRLLGSLLTESAAVLEDSAEAAHKAMDIASHRNMVLNLGAVLIATRTALDSFFKGSDLSDEARTGLHDAFNTPLETAAEMYTDLQTATLVPDADEKIDLGGLQKTGDPVLDAILGALFPDGGKVNYRVVNLGSLKPGETILDLDQLIGGNGTEG